MKKLKIASVLASEILSREELKRVFGGDFGSGNTGSSSGICYCTITTSKGTNVRTQIKLSDPSQSACSESCDATCSNIQKSGGDCLFVTSVYNENS